MINSYVCDQKGSNPKEAWESKRTEAVRETIESCFPDISNVGDLRIDQLEFLFTRAGTQSSFIESRSRMMGAIAAFKLNCDPRLDRCENCPMATVTEEEMILRDEARGRGLGDDDFYRIMEVIVKHG